MKIGGGNYFLETATPFSQTATFTDTDIKNDIFGYYYGHADGNPDQSGNFVCVNNADIGQQMGSGSGVIKITDRGGGKRYLYHGFIFYEHNLVALTKD